MNPTIPSKIADAAACVSVGGCLTGFIAQVTPELQIIALTASIISGVCAAYYHIKLIKKLP